MAGRFGDERGPIPVVPGIGAGGVKCMTRTGGKSAVEIDLADLVGDRIKAIRLGDVLEHGGRPAAYGFVVAIGNRQVNAWATVGRGAENQAVFAESHAPGVVVRAAKELELRTIGLEAEEPLLKRSRSPPTVPLKRRIADDSPDPIVKPVPQVARSGVGVAFPIR